MQRAVISDFAVERVDELELLLCSPLLPGAEIEVHDFALIWQALDVFAHITELGQTRCTSDTAARRRFRVAADDRREAP